MGKFRGLGVLIFLAVFTAASAVVMLLWNSIVVNVFEVGALTFWYAAGLLVLAKLLLGGWHHGHEHFHRHHKGLSRKSGKGPHFHKVWEECCDSKEMRDLHEKFHSMSGKERRDYIRRHMSAVHDVMHGSAAGTDCCRRGSSEDIGDDNLGEDANG